MDAVVDAGLPTDAVAAAELPGGLEPWVTSVTLLPRLMWTQTLPGSDAHTVCQLSLFRQPVTQQVSLMPVLKWRQFYGEYEKNS